MQEWFQDFKVYLICFELKCDWKCFATLKIWYRIDERNRIVYSNVVIYSKVFSIFLSLLSLNFILYKIGEDTRNFMNVNIDWLIQFD